jgi:hypothetical protein
MISPSHPERSPLGSNTGILHARAGGDADMPKATTPAMAAERLLAIAGGVIAGAVTLHLLGFAVSIFVRAGSALGNVALMEWGVSHDRIFVVERLAAVVLLAVGTALVVCRSWVLALPIAACVFVETMALQRFGGFSFSEWTPFSHAARYLTPLALVALWAPGWIGGGARARAFASMWILRLGIALVFVFHGLQALGADPGFIDLMIGSARRWFGYRLTESTAVGVLRVIGVVDIVVGGLILVGRWRPLLVWLCFWGLITAASRITATGWLSYPQLMLRASHYLAPLGVWLLSEWLARSAAIAAARNDWTETTKS